MTKKKHVDTTVVDYVQWKSSGRTVRYGIRSTKMATEYQTCKYYNKCPKRDAKHCFGRDVRLCDLREQYDRMSKV